VIPAKNQPQFPDPGFRQANDPPESPWFNNLTIILNSLQMFIHITQDRSKLDNLLYQKHVQTQVLK